MDEKEKKQERKPKQVAVKVVAQKDQSALVEWAAGDDVRRAYVPAGKIEGGRCDLETLEAGIPYGAPWEDLVDLSGLTPQAVARQLRRHGIWTRADIERNMQGAQRAINRATGLTPARLHTLASQHEAKKEI